MTGCRGISCSEHFLVQLAVVRVPLPPSGMGATARYHRASPQGAELTARHITFSWLRRRAKGSIDVQQLTALLSKGLIHKR